MKTWTKVLLGVVAGAAVGIGAAILGKKHNEDEGFETEPETEDYDSDSEEEAE